MIRSVIFPQKNPHLFHWFTEVNCIKLNIEALVVYPMGQIIDLHLHRLFAKVH